MIRKATLDDLESIVSIEQTFSADAFSRRSLRYFVMRGATLVMVLDEEVVGYSIVLMRSGSHRARLYSIAIADGHRGKGYGDDLLRSCEDYATTIGAKEMILEVSEDNSIAQNLYKSRGYEYLKILPDYYENGVGGIQLGKRLITI